MMTLMETAVDGIRAQRLVAVLRRVSEPGAMVDQLVAAGVRVVEITLDSDDALGTIERLRARGDVTVLAGTVRTAADAESAIAAGAEACVAPGLVAEMVETCRRLGVPAIPGTLTPTEVEAACALGVELVKLFPAGAVGPAYVRDLLAPLDGVQLLVTGGVDSSNAAAFLEAGAVAVGVGSALTAAADLGAEARRLLAAVRARPARHS
jgi:2-dehydro-3-deoxyphosphogluconate aldolase/(4S)-4-hydroxy-2-oxoglutarate aldolase